MRVEAGHVVVTGYVEIDQVRLGCRDRMAVGDVAGAYQKLLQLGSAEQWPCPVGRWNGDRFVIHDGRHQYVASLMLGRSHILVAWIEKSGGRT